MHIPRSILDKIVKPLSKKTGLSQQTVMMIITIGLPILLRMFKKRSPQRASASRHRKKS